MVDIEVKSDLLMAVLNLIEAEHHARFTFLSTGEEKWLDKLFSVRQMRVKYMDKLEKDEPGQAHCYNKHMLSASFRLFEVGDKLLAEDKRQEAVECYTDGYSFILDFISDNWSEEEKGGQDKWNLTLLKKFLNPKKKTAE